MGQKSSQIPIKQGIIKLETDQVSYMPGNFIKGNIKICIFQSFCTPNLKLKLKVEECTEFNGFGGHKLHYLKEITIVNFKHEIIAPGEYDYPFNIYIPVNLPGSFEYYDKDCLAYITYILEASLKSIVPKNSIMNSILILVNQQSNFRKIPVIRENSKNLYSLICLPQGKSRLKVSINEENFLNSGSLRVFCELDNRESKLNATKIKAKIHKYILLKDNNNRSKLITRKISRVNYNYVYPKKEITKFTLEIFIKNQNISNKKYFQKCDHLNLFKNKEILNMLHTTISSEFIRCIYVLELKSFFKESFFNISGPHLKTIISMSITESNNEILKESNL